MCEVRYADLKMSNKTHRFCFADKEIQKLLEKIAQEEGFCEYQIETTDGSVKGDGYIGIITSIKISGKDAEDKNKTLNLVIKCASKSDALRSELPVALLFEREIYVYDTVYPAFQTVEIGKGLPPSFFAPKLYKVSVDHKSEAILMENLKEEGYKLYDRKIPMDDGHVRLVMTQYGRFHAISFALRDQHPEKFAELVEPLSDVLCKFLKEIFFNSLMSRCSKALESLDEKSDQEAVEKCKMFIDNIEKFLDEIEVYTDGYSAVLHADCWTNNMMFKYEDNQNPKNPTQVRFLDFQASKLGPPVLDLAYFFYACGSKEIIDNLNLYMQVYYDSFSVHLRKLGNDPDKMYPYAVLEQQWKRLGKFGLLTAAMAIHVMLSEKDELVDLKDAAESGANVAEIFNYDIANVGEYNDRLRHIILHLVANDFL